MYIFFLFKTEQVYLPQRYDFAYLANLISKMEAH